MKRKTALKRKPVRIKRKVKRLAKAGHKRVAPAQSSESDTIGTWVPAAARALGLTLDPAWHQPVFLNLRLILSHAALVERFSLPDDAEPAPVFHA